MQLNLFDKPIVKEKVPTKKLSKRERDWITKSFIKKTGIGSTRKSK